MNVSDDVSTVLFDLDGTLVDHEAAARAGAVTLARHRGLAEPEEQWRRWHTIERQWFTRFELGAITHTQQRVARCREFLGEPGLSDAEALGVYETYLAAYRAAWRAYDDAHDALTRASDSGRAVGVFTNGVREMQQAKLECTGLDDERITLLPTVELGAAKPAPESYRLAAEAMGVGKPPQVLMIGDSWANDVAGPLAVGWRATYLTRAGLPREGAPNVTTLADVRF
ncbi:HAD family hydrolase [Corynebacterium guangdongense]|uniref:Hydrolase of the HAD superfamily n=1 Tax=Corynebacterium guangdongense TaxID=1783348 RepID=A0ABU2A1Y1_9CORY|nr:HAD family hydrolase [Corynebacterium guangdongense]MDR7330492.1 putative hydrolase of the HAD superfamily [Corynebacterium guangdongense]WJZ19048.1 Phosphatase [Corynebacterium guangdongense]